MNYQYKLLRILLYLGYITAILILTIILLAFGTLIYQLIINWTNVLVEFVK